MKILLTTINARYAHCSYSLRTLKANMGPLAPDTGMVEFTLSEKVDQMCEALLRHNPAIIGMSVYIWNRDPMRDLAAYLKAAAPQITIVLGGPEVSYALRDDPLVSLADHIIAGEGEVSFPKLCADLLHNREREKFIAPDLPDISQLALPYDLYSDHDIGTRTIYVESSRGCPFRCNFCLSALDTKVRRFDKDQVLASLLRLHERGVRHFKFLDRDFTFGHPVAILEQFLKLGTENLLLHFELHPGTITEEIENLFLRYPSGSIQLEIGVQTLTEAVATRIERAQQNDSILGTISRLSSIEAIHLHADLIVGLPGESLAQVGEGFDRLLATGVDEIQVGMLKLLHGAPMTRHVDTYDLRFSPSPPYEVISTSTIPFMEMQRLRRFARYWDLMGNSGNFTDTMWLILSSDAPQAHEEDTSPFATLLELSDWLFATLGTTHAISLKRLAQALFTYLTIEKNVPDNSVNEALQNDFRRTNQRRIPDFLMMGPISGSAPTMARFNKRQKRHQGSEAVPN